MPDDLEVALARSHRAVIVAAAGCGKTETIAKAVGLHPKGRQLVLTHTHAGVRALRDRFKKLNIPPIKYHVDTIAGWALAYAKSYPALSGLTVVEPREDHEWQLVYESATRLCVHSAIQKVVQTSYDGIYVDEYQDCTLPQHRLVKNLAAIIPCRIVGDPLQGIFDFADPVVDWEQDVFPNFERLPDLETPWRWKSTNHRLGEWLVQARMALCTGGSVDLSVSPIDWKIKSQKNQWLECIRVAKQKGSITAIHRMPYQAHNLARSLRGAFTAMDEVYCKELFAWAKKFDRFNGQQLAIAVIDFCAICMTKVSTELKSIRGKLEARGVGSVRSGKHVEVARLLQGVTESKDMNTVLNAMVRIEKLKDRVLHRRELWREMLKAIRECKDGKYDSIYEAAWHVRSRASAIGRGIEKRTVSRALLIKGLEFDHAIVLDADALNAKELYVAITRGTKSLAVLSGSSTVQKPAPFPISTAQLVKSKPHF